MDMEKSNVTFQEMQREDDNVFGNFSSTVSFRNGISREERQELDQRFSLSLPTENAILIENENANLALPRASDYNS